MKYTITINQKSVIDNGWDLSLNHLAILETIVAMINSSKFVAINDENGVWYWVKVTKILDELPILKIKERWCKVLISDLVKEGLLELNPNNQKLYSSYIRIGANYEKYSFATPMQNNATPMQNNAYPPMQNNAYPPMQNNAENNNISIYNNTSNYHIKNPLLEKEDTKSPALEEGVEEFEDLGDGVYAEKKEKEKSCAKKEKIDFEYLKDFFNTHSGSLSKIQVLTETRKKRLESLEKQFGVQKLEAVVLLAGASDFLQGKNDRGWKADFDWVMKPQNFVKILEGNYSNKTPHKEEKEAMIGRQTVSELADGLVMAKDAITDLMKNYGV